MKHVLLALFLLVGCGDDGGGGGTPDAAVDSSGSGDSGGGGAFSVTGVVNGMAPANTNVAVIWVVSSGSPDYAYKYGDGSVAGATFTASFAAAAPAAALNNGTIGVGIVVQLAPGTTAPDGMFDEATFDTATGFTPLHSIIFKVDGATGVDWIEAFPTGYSCGMCVQNGTGFDGWAPTDCSNVTIEQGLTAEACNWT